MVVFTHKAAKYKDLHVRAAKFYLTKNACMKA